MSTSLSVSLQYPKLFSVCQSFTVSVETLGPSDRGLGAKIDGTVSQSAGYEVNTYIDGSPKTLLIYSGLYSPPKHLISVKTFVLG